MEESLCRTTPEVTIIIIENLFFYIQLIIYETFKQITRATCMHTHFSQCALITIIKVNIWVLSANWLGLQSNALWFFFVQVHCNMHAFCNYVSLNNIFSFSKDRIWKKNILKLYKVLMGKKYQPEGYTNFQSMYIKKFIHAMTKLFFIIACK